MKRRSVGSLVALCFTLVACGGASEPAPAPATPSTPTPAPKPVSVAPAAPVTTTPGPESPEPTAEQKKKIEDGRALREDRAKWEQEKKAEAARWTPELRTEATGLAGKAYPNTKAALKATMAGKHRKPGNAERDKSRHPLETLEFFGFKPTMTVVDVGPGDGWYTELLAPAVAKTGKYVASANDPNGSVEQRGTFYGQRWNAFVEQSPELYSKVQTIVVDSKAPKLALDGTVDMVLIMRGVHGMKAGGTLGGWLAEVHRALKTGGVLGIEEHRAPEGANPDETAKKGYLPEKWVIAEVEGAGFKLAAKSEINANPKDTKDYAEGVWTLPPTFRLKDKDHGKYAAIGESDRMTLKFVKVTAKTNQARP